MQANFDALESASSFVGIGESLWVRLGHFARSKVGCTYSYCISVDLGTQASEPVFHSSLPGEPGPEAKCLELGLTVSGSRMVKTHESYLEDSSVQKIQPKLMAVRQPNTYLLL